MFETKQTPLNSVFGVMVKKYKQPAGQMKITMLESLTKMVLLTKMAMVFKAVVKQPIKIKPVR